MRAPSCSMSAKLAEWRLRVLEHEIELAGPADRLLPLATAYARFQTGSVENPTRIELDDDGVSVEGRRHPLLPGINPTLQVYQHYLNLLLAVFAIVVSFPFGVLLALGRTSNYPVIRLACTTYIEAIRGVPLITILLMGWLVLPDFLPSFSVPIVAPEGLDRIELTYRVMIALTMFSAAYVAEAIRGGLQAVPNGQVEAAEALGLSNVRIQALIVLPQAIRAVIPALVGQFISIYKDTSLIFIVGSVELLRAGRLVTEGQLEFTGSEMEVLLFVALLFWIVAFSMSRLSQRLEQNLGVGER